MEKLDPCFICNREVSVRVTPGTYPEEKCFDVSCPNCGILLALHEGSEHRAIAGYNAVARAPWPDDEPQPGNERSTFNPGS